MAELQSHTRFAIVGYWKLPETTAEAFCGPYCSVGDLARRDDEGYFHLVDRTSNMIMSCGETIYPSDVEHVLGSQPEAKDVAVVGVPNEVGRGSVRAMVGIHDE